MNYKEIILQIAKRTDKVILFHSATGKDSIALAEMITPHFKKVVCVFMYIVKGLEYENNYIRWAEKKYSNIEFYQTPHYCLNSFIKNGYLGIKQDKQIANNKISKIDKLIKDKFNIQYSIYGFKKNDGITRRLMLNGYKNGVCEKTKKVYPLMDLKNENILSYIKQHNLINSFMYNPLKPSSGCDVSDINFLLYVRDKYPNDLKKIIQQFPFTEIKLFKYDNFNKN